MSISYKKINSMISSVINEKTDLNEDKKDVLREVCEKVYMIESSVEQTSGHQIINDIKGEISLKADRF